ncbi:MAG: 50S ribosomal protein L13 [Chlorobiaceae bacterium]|nr:50S ribosomal protein L13 [Chlorobiaceae bacterium]MBA4310611.1 50S ribosomal protein L13 [Chlorobiaceae bacterium]
MKQEKLTRFVKPSEADQKWYLVDAKDQTLGRFASKVARIIRGKNKPVFTPNMDTGDFVVVINAEKIKIAAKRELNKEYIHHSGYPGGLKSKSYKEMKATKPEFIIQNAVKGMLPKTKLGKKLITKLKVYKGDIHPHEAQKPELISL